MKKFLGLLLVLALILSVGATAFAIVKGLEKSKQSIVRVGESVTIPQGAEIQSVVCVGGSVTVYGKVSEDVVAVGGSVFLKDTATVGNNVTAVGGKVMREPGAIVKGNITEVSMGGITPAVSYFVGSNYIVGLALFQLLTFIGIIILAIISVSLFMVQLGVVSAKAEEHLFYSFIIGFLVAVASIIVLPVLFFSMIGIPLIPGWIILITAAFVFGYFSICHLLGKRSLHAFKIYGKSMMVETLVGVVLLSLVGFVPIGGLIIKIIAALSGLGAVYQTRFGTR
jgi:hypothetical protein